MRWRFDSSAMALFTSVGHRGEDGIRVTARRGCALHGPYLAMPAGHLRARVLLAPGGTGTVMMEITYGRKNTRLSHGRVRINGQRSIQQDVDVPADVELLEVRIFCRGKADFTILGLEIDLERDHGWSPLEPTRPVGVESGKSYAAKIADGFFDRYLSGPAVMEVGYRGYDHATVPIVPQAIGVDVGYPGYDGRTFPFADSSVDGIYSSHCYEHIPDHRAVLRDWYRLLRVGGFLVIVVPHQHLFERKRMMPSRWNPDHQRFYTPRILLAEIEAAFDENSYRIRHLVENDTGFDYSRPPREATTGCYEIELVVEKIAAPGWVVDDGSVRPYPPADFALTETQRRLSPYEVRLDLGAIGHMLWGPYSRLNSGHYEADFFFDGGNARGVELMLEVARDGGYLATAHNVLSPEQDRHRVTVPFTNDTDGAYFEFRVRNCQERPDATLTFRGVELRHAPPAD